MKITAYNFFVRKQNFTVSRVIEIEGNGQLQITMLHLYFIDEVIILSLIHNNILHHIDYRKQQKEGLARNGNEVPKETICAEVKKRKIVKK